MRNYLTSCDPFFDYFFPVKGENNHGLMKTDIIEKKDSYLLKVNVPGVKKEDVKISLKDGYLTVNVKFVEDIKDEEKYLYHERREGDYTRSYFVNENISEEDVSASMDNGVLLITVKKVEPKEKKNQYIAIS